MKIKESQLKVILAEEIQSILNGLDPSLLAEFYIPQTTADFVDYFAGRQRRRELDPAPPMSTSIERGEPDLPDTGPNRGATPDLGYWGTFEDAMLRTFGGEGLGAAALEKMDDLSWIHPELERAVAVYGREPVEGWLMKHSSGGGAGIDAEEWQRQFSADRRERLGIPQQPGLSRDVADPMVASGPHQAYWDRFEASQRELAQRRDAEAAEREAERAMRAAPQPIQIDTTLERGTPYQFQDETEAQARARALSLGVGAGELPAAVLYENYLSLNNMVDKEIDVLLYGE